MKYVFVENHRAEFSPKAMCRVLRVARMGNISPNEYERRLQQCA